MQKEITIKAIPIMEFDEGVAVHARLLEIADDWEYKSFGVECREILTAIAKEKFKTTAPLVVPVSPSEVLRLDENILQAALEKAHFTLCLKSETVALDHLNEVGRRLRKWRDDYFIGLMVDGFLSTNYLIERIVRIAPTYVRLSPGDIALLEMNEGDGWQKRFAFDLVSTILEMMRCNGILAIATGLDTDDQLTNVVGARIPLIEGGIVESRYHIRVNTYSIKSESTFVN